MKHHVSSDGDDVLLKINWILHSNHVKLDLVKKTILGQLVKSLTLSHWYPRVLAIKR